MRLIRFLRIWFGWRDMAWMASEWNEWKIEVARAHPESVSSTTSTWYSNPEGD